jgi:hypothetical protein
VATFRKLPIVLLAFTVIAGAADPSLLNLVMPDAKVLVGANVSKILATPIAKEISSQIQGGNPLLQKFLQQSGFDPTRDLQEIMIASTGQGRNPPTLVLVRGTFDVAKFSAFVSSGDKRAVNYEGVTIMRNLEQTDGAMAFLNSSMAIGGDLDQVRAAIHRHTHGAGFSSTLAEKVDALSERYDVWVFSAVSMSDMASNVPNPNMRQAGEILKSIREVSGGIKFGPDMEIAAEMLTHTEKEAASLADSLRLLAGLVTMNQQGPDALKPENLKLTVDARTVRVSLTITAEQMKKAYRTQMARNTLRPPVPEKPRPVDTGLTIQTSEKDMGTVVLPPAKKE